MKISTDTMIKRYEIEDSYEFRKWAQEIPKLKFASNWRIQMLPPFGGTIVRFGVVDEHNNYVSIYLDCYDALGIYGSPYWEIHPLGGDVARYDMNNTTGLIAGITESFLEQRE